jgi:RNA polymerase sigma factor (sigma-70 family)
MRNAPTDPDAQLLQQLTAGEVDQAIWREFVRRIRRWICHHYPWLYAQSDDLAGETAVCAFESLPSYRGEARFMRWVHGIAHHIVSKRLREQGEAVVVSFEEIGDKVPAEDEIAKRILHLAAEVAMRTLTDQERTVFMWRVHDDVDHKEIARRLGISHNASRQTWMRASEKIGRYRREQER